MKKAPLSILLALCLAISASASTKKERFVTIHTKDLAAVIKDPTLKIYDLNTPSTRAKDGIIPGAHLLASSKSYDVAKELPSEKKTHLVFYCANTQCMASHQAAERAIDAGYQNVAVMVDGIQGWKKAGQPTAKP